MHLGDAARVAFPLRRLTDVHVERNARARQQRPQPHQLFSANAFVG